MRNKLRRALALLLALVVFIGAMNFNVYAEGNEMAENSVSVNGEISVSENQSSITEEIGWDGVTTEKVYEGDGYKVTFLLASCWNGGYNVTVKVENVGNEIIQDWYLRHSLSGQIINIWNAEIYQQEKEEYIIKNAGWNQDIPIGGFVEYGFGVNEDFRGFPTEYELMGQSMEADKEDYSIEYILESNWENGFTGRITISNNTEQVLEDWTVEFDFGRTITSIWDAEIESCKENHYVIRNAGYNSNIAVGETVTFGFTGEDGNADDRPNAVELFSYNITNECTVTFDLNYVGAIEKIEGQSVKKSEYAMLPEAPEREGYFFWGWYTDKQFSEYFEFDKNPITKNITLYARWVDFNDNKDTDGDNISDVVEELLDIDKMKSDTDDDGVSDYDEIDLLKTSPRKADTDENGVIDGEEDNDWDKLTNLEELACETNPNVSDTDGDRLNDYEEVCVYRTDSLNVDTDGDGASDGKEVEMQTDPLVAQSSFLMKVSTQEEGNVIASVEMELLGEQVESLKVQKVDNETFFPKEMPGYMGSAYDFSVDGEFEKAIISFEFDAALLENEDFEPTIYYFNEEEQQLEPLETMTEKNVASAEVNHFSKYILINRRVFEESFAWEDVWELNDYEGVQIVFVIDDSGSMTTNDMYNKRLTVAQDLIEQLPENSEMGVVKFANKTTKLTSYLTKNKEYAKSYLSSSYFVSSGGTYMYNAISDAFSLYESTEENMLKVMVLLSDGQTSETWRHSTVITAANNKGIKLYTVGLGSSIAYFDNYLKPLANNTGGAFYLAENADKLAEIYSDIGKKIDIELDSDADGIPDYYEENMVIFNGIQMNTDKYHWDTDGDGLSDGEEVAELKFQYNESKTKVIVTGKLKSNPLSIDSDNDGLYDGMVRMVGREKVAPKDPEPFEKNGPDGIWDVHVLQQESGVNPTEYGEGEGLDESVPQFVADTLVRLVVLFRSPVNYNGEEIREKVLIVKNFLNDCVGETGTKVEAYLCNFIYDEEGIAYHSQIDTWQREFGFNEFYDEIFDIGSYMENETYSFSANGEECILWLWKGDYWDLHSGAEVGLYSSPEDYIEVMHYHAIDFELPMTLELYEHKSSTQIKNIFSWEPTEKQWWITGFTGSNPMFIEPNPENMLMLASIDFAGYEEWYDGLKRKKENVSDDEKVKYDSLIFDEDGYTLWIVW